MFGDNIKGKGYGTDIVKTVMKYEFEELQLNRLYGWILEYNKASMGLYKKCGWEEEGIFKESVFKNNRYIDEIPMGISKNKYEKIKDEI